MMTAVRASWHASPLRYPGGKAKLTQYFKALVRGNNLLDTTYVEPFAGGCGVGLSLLFHGYVSHVVINDLSGPIYAFWRAVVEEPDRFQEQILKVELSTEEWLKQRRVFQHSDGSTDFDVGFATFYLNRTNHSGVLNAGMIGGHSQRSAYGLDARFNRAELAARINRIGRHSRNITILNLDASDLIANVQDIAGIPNPLIYIDPPYFKKGRDLYYDFYRPDDHKKLRDSIVEIDPVIRWVVSYDNETEINELYRNYKSLQYNLNYSVRNGRVGNEVMFFSENLSPARLSEGGLQEIGDQFPRLVG